MFSYIFIVSKVTELKSFLLYCTLYVSDRNHCGLTTAYGVLELVNIDSGNGLVLLDSNSIMVMVKYLIWANEMAFLGSCDRY